MRKIIITNKGLLSLEDLAYIGNSSKRGDNTKIGQFGSGWKYALAWLLRNDCCPKIYSGTKEISLNTESIVTSRNMFRAIVIDGQKTSLTVEMGMKWKGWMALREIISNAIDEGEHSIKVEYSEPSPKDGNTTIIIPANGELIDVLDHYEKYFSFNRTPHYSNKHGQAFVKSANTDIVCYRKGIRCYDYGYKTMLDFNFNDIEISEDRIASTGDMDRAARELLEVCDDYNILKHSLLCEYKDFLPRTITAAYINCVRIMVTEGHKFTSPVDLIPAKDAILLSRDWFWKLVEEGILVNPIDELFRTLKHEFFPIHGYDIEQAELKHYLSAYCKEAEVFVGVIKAGYTTVDFFSNGDKFFVSEKHIKRTTSGEGMKDLACDMLLEQRTCLKQMMISRM